MIWETQPLAAEQDFTSPLGPAIKFVYGHHPHRVALSPRHWKSMIVHNQHMHSMSRFRSRVVVVKVYAVTNQGLISQHHTSSKHQWVQT